MKKLFIKDNCNFCRPCLSPTTQINMKLPQGKMIDVVNCSEWERFGMKTKPIMDKFQFDGYPTLILEDNKIINILTKEQLKAFYEGYLQNDKIY